MFTDSKVVEWSRLSAYKLSQTDKFLVENLILDIVALIIGFSVKDRNYMYMKKYERIYYFNLKEERIDVLGNSADLTVQDSIL